MDDWNNIEPVFVDFINDQNPDADFNGTDLHEFYLAKDDIYLYIMMTLYDGDPKTDIFTQYGFQANQSRGYGDSPGDHLAKAYFQDGEWHAAVNVRFSTENYLYASEYVGVGSSFIEWKVPLSDMGTLNGKYVTERFYLGKLEQ